MAPMIWRIRLIHHFYPDGSLETLDGYSAEGTYNPTDLNTVEGSYFIAGFGITIHPDGDYPFIEGTSFYNGRQRQFLFTYDREGEFFWSKVKGIS